MDEAYTDVFLDKLTKQRPRTNFYTHTVYTPPQTKEREKKIAQEFRTQNMAWVCDDSPIILNVEVELKIPSKAKKSEKEAMLYGKILPIVKPDIDNTLKLVLDALNGIAYKDDVQVVRSSISKMYGERNRLKIYIKKLSKVLQ